MDHEATQFFDSIAETWDSRLAAVDFQTLPLILKRAGVTASDSVLDIGAGTGILVPFLSELSVGGYHGIDVSSGMAAQFRKKFPEHAFTVGDFETVDFGTERFSVAIVFNAFPHFENKASVLQKCCALLHPAGRCIVAHSLTREALNEHHRRKGRAVSEHILPDLTAVSQLFWDAGFCDVVVEDSQYFFAMGTRRE